MTASPHTGPKGPCPGARTFGITVRSCVRCGALLPKGCGMTDPWQYDPDRTTRRETPVQTVIETRGGRTVVGESHRVSESVAPGETRAPARATGDQTRLFQPVDVMRGQMGLPSA